MDSIILESMLTVNPEIPREQAEKVSAALSSELTARGLLSSKDLKHVTKEHLQAQQLNEFQAMRLIDLWKSGRHLKESNQQHQPQSSTDESTIVVPIPWDLIWQLDKIAKKDKGELGIALLKEHRRPSAAAELLLVNTMVAAAKDLYPHAKRGIMDNMAIAVAKKFSASFVDKIGNTDLGYKRFIKHCKDQFDNFEPRPVSKRRKQDKENLIISMPVKAVLGLSLESWHDIDLPPGEIEETQEELRAELIEFAKKKPDKNSERILYCLKTTYPTQRKVILQVHKKIRDHQNKKKRKRNEDEEQVPEISDLINDWPFLFRPLGLELHFNRLYDIKINDCLELYFKFNASRMIDYLISSQGTNGKTINVYIETAIKKGKDTLCVNLIGLIMLLSASFKENIEAFILKEEPTLQMEDVAGVNGLPNTPCIVVCGPNILMARKYYVCMDKFCYLASNSLKDVFISAFSSFFIFHLDFPKKFGLVCEFIQREILNINFEAGSKRAEANSSSPLPEKISRLNSDCEKYHKTLEAARLSLEAETADSN